MIKKNKQPTQGGARGNPVGFDDEDDLKQDILTYIEFRLLELEDEYTEVSYLDNVPAGV